MSKPTSNAPGLIRAKQEAASTKPPGVRKHDMTSGFARLVKPRELKRKQESKA